MDKAPLTAHLGELWSRIVFSVIAILATFMASFYFSEDLFRLLTMPIHNNVSFSIKSPFIIFYPGANPDLKLIFIAPAEAVWMHIKISFISASILSSPPFFCFQLSFLPLRLYIKINHSNSTVIQKGAAHVMSPM